MSAHSFQMFYVGPNHFHIKSVLYILELFFQDHWNMHEKEVERILLGISDLKEAMINNCSIF